VTSVFYLYRDSQPRRRALAAPPGSAERYSLFGLDELRDHGLSVRHNLERSGRIPGWARSAGGATKWAVERAGGYGGDFASVIASLGPANSADVVLSTVDTVGIPAMLLARAGRLKPPLVYIAVGLPERLVRLRNERVRRAYAAALGASAAVVAYSEHEADELRRWLDGYGHGPEVVFVPFGANVDALVPSSAPPVDDVVSVGADPHRDFEQLLAIAERMPQRSFRLVVGPERARGLPRAPENVAIEVDLRFADMLARLTGARVVALPVRENSYSGATTVLLQAMALAKPVVVTRTHAIASGYGLVDGENCRVVPPGDADSFERVLKEVLRDEWHARALGASARKTVERDLTWGRYVDRIETILRDASATRPDARSRRG
jgi:glycosyltransferase involved in cell wall biosynthesis